MPQLPRVPRVPSAAAAPGSERAACTRGVDAAALQGGQHSEPAAGHAAHSTATVLASAAIGGDELLMPQHYRLAAAAQQPSCQPDPSEADI